MAPSANKQSQFCVYLNYTHSTLHTMAVRVATSRTQLSPSNTQGSEWTSQLPAK